MVRLKICVVPVLNLQPFCLKKRDCINCQISLEDNAQNFIINICPRHRIPMRYFSREERKKKQIASVIAELSVRVKKIFGDLIFVQDLLFVFYFPKYLICLTRTRGIKTCYLATFNKIIFQKKTLSTCYNMMLP